MADFGSGIGFGGGGINVDGNGISGGGSAGTGGGPHLSVNRELQLGTTVNRLVKTYQGPYDKLCDMAKGIDKFVSVSEPDLPTGGSDTEGTGYGYQFVSDIKLTRGNGNVGRLQVTVTQNRQVALISVDSTEVQRPIKTWKADADNDKPDLAQIREWEAKEETNYSSYANFTGLSGNTKKLAEMIFKGIEHYSVYAPAVTVTLNTHSFPQLSSYPVGSAYGAPEVPYGWRDVHGRDISDIVNNLKKPESGNDYIWVLGSSRSTPNADGTYQWVLQYQACDSVEEALYGT